MLFTMLYSTEIKSISPTQRWQLLKHPVLEQRQIQLWICHLETGMHEVSGNKCLKLKQPLHQVMQQQLAGIVTFGGAFSNHLCAVAASCHALGLHSVGYVRTDKLDLVNPTLEFCQKKGMQLIALNRQDYRLRHDAQFCQYVQQQHPGLLLVPEGGTSVAGAAGVAEFDFSATPDGKADLVISACASGGTLAGLINSGHSPVLGISVVKDSTLPDRIQQLLTANAHQTWSLLQDYTGHGYGRFDTTLLAFCQELASYQLLLEPVYTGKAMAGLFDLVQSDQFSPGSRLSFFHTGGLQGLRGMHYRGLITATDLALLSGLTAD